MSRVIDQAILDGDGRRVTLREVDRVNWPAVADVAPLDEQRGFVAALAARYLLLSAYEEPWHSLGVYADETVVGHVMWGRDEDGSCWVGGMIVDRAEQGRGVGRALLRTLLGWLSGRRDCRVIRMTYQPDNTAARSLTESLGFTTVDGMGEQEVVVEISARRARRVGAPDEDPDA